MDVTKNWLLKTVLCCLLLTVWLPGAVRAEDYTIAVGDKLSISVWGNKDLDTKVTVRPDGKISFPLIGEVKASGFTPLQLRDTITTKLSEFINNPEITVNLLESKQFMVYIFGNLRAAGERKVKDNTNLLQLLSMMGTIPENIDLKSSFLVRDNRKLPVDLYGLLKEGDLGQNVYLKNGDTIFFKERPKQKVESVKKTEPFKNIIRVVGEVKQEKSIKYEQGMTILDAILRAGGFTPYARPSGTKVVRRHENQVEEIMIDMDAVRAGEIDKNILLEPGDVISVPASLF